MTTATMQSETTIASKLDRIRTSLESMPVGSCGVKWDLVAWRCSEHGWIVGENGVRKDGSIHTLQSAVDWFAWKRGIVS